MFGERRTHGGIIVWAEGREERSVVVRKRENEAPRGVVWRDW